MYPSKKSCRKINRRQQSTKKVFQKENARSKANIFHTSRKRLVLNFNKMKAQYNGSTALPHLLIQAPHSYMQPLI